MEDFFRVPESCCGQGVCSRVGFLYATLKLVAQEVENEVQAVLQKIMLELTWPWGIWWEKLWVWSSAEPREMSELDGWVPKSFGVQIKPPRTPDTRHEVAGLDVCHVKFWFWFGLISLCYIPFSAFGNGMFNLSHWKYELAFFYK